MLFSSSMSQTGTHYPVMQLVWCGAGLVAATAAACLPYHHLKQVSLPLFVVALALLGALLVWGEERNGARRWFEVAEVSFQPSELGKLALVIGLAHYGDRQQRAMGSWVWGLLIPGLGIGLTLGLILLEPDWGTTLLLAAVSCIMLLVAGTCLRYLVVPALAGVALMGVLLMNDPTRLTRVNDWLHPTANREGSGYQTWMGTVTLGTGGVTGTGLGDGRQKYGYLPEHLTDYILAVIGEELGVIATLGVLASYAAMLLCGAYIAWHATETFGMLLATGLTFLIGLQAFINIGVVTALLPNKGLPLPFISRGGSNLLLMLVCVGLLWSIARRASKPAASEPVLTDLDEAPLTTA
jgi:cell division protein FtsW